MNIRIDIEYEGASFQGWQIQGESPTVQKSLEDCITNIQGKRSPLQGASRTDSGVHARMQVANFHTDYKRLSPNKWRAALNATLPPTIRIIRAIEVTQKFNANKDALLKIYEYRVLNRAFASALDRRVYFYPDVIDWDRIRECLPYFVGKKDFKAFQGARASVKTTVREVTRFDLIQEPEGGLYRFVVEGTGFLKQMVRAMVGTAMEVGEGKRTPDEIASVILSKDRRRAGRTVPAQGLCLVWIEYPL